MVYVQVYLYIPALIIKVNMNDCVENVQIATETLDTTFLQPSCNCWPMTIIHLIGILFIVIHLRLPEIQSNCVKTIDSINYLSTNCVTVHSMLSILLTIYLCQLSLSGEYISLASRHHIHIIINTFYSSDYQYEMTRTIAKLCEYNKSTGHWLFILWLSRLLLFYLSNLPRLYNYNIFNQ